jgi:hypothetical protein
MQTKQIKQKNMENLQFIQVIEQAFEGMQSRQETFAIVRLFDYVQQITLPSAGIQQAYYVRVDLIVSQEKENSIRILYRDRQFELLPFSRPKEQIIAVECLRKNNVLPTAQEFLGARSLLNSMSCTATEILIHGDYSL